MDDSQYTYPDTPVGIGFSDAEKKRWDRNFKKLQERVMGKFGMKKRGRPRKKKAE
jgi:hypothetical protein